MGILLPQEERGRHSQQYRTRSGYAEWLPLAQRPMGILGGISSRHPQVQNSKWPDYLVLPLPCQWMGQLPWSTLSRLFLAQKRAVHWILSSHCTHWVLEAEGKPVPLYGFDSFAGWEWGGPGRDGVHQDLFGAMFSEFHETLELMDESFDFPELKKMFMDLRRIFFKVLQYSVSITKL